ncbi:transcriptional regulator WhiB [Pseudonocardia sulfidoxydans NBRC 16205]|uniref:Transcriptional regulator WhiB n=1 Tax=Pseudonocardia sulfidoxydans NBRC 16205 TaxID=1223511 RepID=A0A511DLZ3_9PSEU|nr:WhiB family transcriptional regulator [Pseudonocardia sulfidoxydans]GEL25831.1 transcriptional regulator WhiB [Pseudonocardia sulfidoxydans NBRC 16205]
MFVHRPESTCTPVRDGDWRARAACRDHDPELFFPVGDGEPARAQEHRAFAVCAGCAVSGPCLQWALANGPEGVWGATTTDQRCRIRRAGPPFG